MENKAINLLRKRVDFHHLADQYIDDIFKDLFEIKNLYFDEYQEKQQLVYDEFFTREDIMKFGDKNAKKIVKAYKYNYFYWRDMTDLIVPLALPEYFDEFVYIIGRAWDLYEDPKIHKHKINYYFKKWRNFLMSTCNFQTKNGIK